MVCGIVCAERNTGAGYVYVPITFADRFDSSLSPQPLDGVRALGTPIRSHMAALDHPLQNLPMQWKALPLVVQRISRGEPIFRDTRPPSPTTHHVHPKIPRATSCSTPVRQLVTSLFPGNRGTAALDAAKHALRCWNKETHSHGKTPVQLKPRIDDPSSSNANALHMTTTAPVQLPTDFSTATPTGSKRLRFKCRRKGVFGDSKAMRRNFAKATLHFVSLTPVVVEWS